MSKIISIGTADAKFKVSQSNVKQFVYQLFSNCKLEVDRLINVFDNSSIENRHFSVPFEWFSKEHSFSERNELFINNAICYSQEAIEECLQKSGIPAESIDHIFFITTTGLATPSIDSILFNKFKFKSHIKRTPVWGLGCAGGAVGLSRAMDYTKAYPDKIALVVAIELCSLTFQKDDLSKSNLIATSLFSDGAAAALVIGENVPNENRGVHLIDSFSTTFPDSLDVMGWEIIDNGFQVLFSKDIPSIVENLVKPNVMEFLKPHGISLKDIKYFIAHPGGYKVINAFEKSLSLPSESFVYSKTILREHGNMSSPSVLYVLNEFLEEQSYKPREYGVISALGPGFSSELLLFRTP